MKNLLPASQGIFKPLIQIKSAAACCHNFNPVGMIVVNQFEEIGRIIQVLHLIHKHNHPCLFIR